MRMFLCVLLFITLLPNQVSAESTKGDRELAIVIDDFGNNMGGTDEMLKLPVTLTVAIMPFLETTERDANLAHSLGHEVIVHVPMEPIKGKKSWLGPGAITTNLSNGEIRKRINAAIDAVPHAVGMNHHMGSKATADERVMRIVLEICRERGLYYLDSRTTDKTVIPELSEEIGVPYLENELFFDDVYTIRHMSRKAQELAERLKDNDAHIAIGHVGIAGEKMVAVLTEYIPIYKDDAVIVRLSEMIPGFEMIDESMP
ncbi:divergent polysaccharide deacetylase family protein [Pseudalkalibacillus hwajinpoensis]|uniref:Divergent polysaccharide deacetylase family protein n=1 Tax=Guptibacillus hwajinpoensis TaxID=208199 RepID=A0A4V5PXU3_9BACL|nr:divergent polysaccharide deacetylase family protein [Pseudalkalibacillus hwajinpoensis]TKD67488.1 divergent polysaccharide deacetylase family protein [Pseudalkalibacillus hwajinpoensis]